MASVAPAAGKGITPAHWPAVGDSGALAHSTSKPHGLQVPGSVAFARVLPVSIGRPVEGWQLKCRVAL